MNGQSAWGGSLLPRGRRRLRPYLDLTAMIDAVFILLIFFAVTTTFAGARAGLPLKLPSAKTARPVPTRVVVTLFPGQPARVGEETVAKDELGRAVKAAAKGDTEAQVVVVADEKVSLVGVLDEVRASGFHRIALAATPERGADEAPQR